MKGKIIAALALTLAASTASARPIVVDHENHWHIGNKSDNYMRCKITDGNKTRYFTLRPRKQSVKLYGFWRYDCWYLTNV